MLKFDWGPYLDFAAWALPTLLTIAFGVAAFRPPRLATTQSKRLWLAGLIVFCAAMVSVTVAQQYQDRLAADHQQTEIKVRLDTIASALQVSPHAPLYEILSKITGLKSEFEAHRWAPLKAQERAALEARLRELPGQQIGIACATPDCVELADNIHGDFQLGGWQPDPVYHGGGIGIDGLTGIRVDACGGTATKLKTIIEAVTKLKVEAIDEPTCSGKAELIVGLKPF
jgi:hypothetical protein